VYHNHHAIRLTSLEREEKLLVNEILSTREKLGWFEKFDINRAHSIWSQLKREIHATHERLGEIDKALQSTSAQLATACKAAKPGIFGRFYMSSERSVATRQVTALKTRADKLRNEQSTLTAELVEKETSHRRVAADLERYRGFDPLETLAILPHLGTKLQQTQAGMDHARKASERWEATAGEVAREYGKAQQEIRIIKSDMAIAETLQRNLGAAQTARERAQIHQDCETRFGSGNGSPGNVMREAKSTLRKLERNVEKLEHRLEDIIRVLDKEIARLILDGSNLCYATTSGGKRSFVGVEPLKALVARLCEDYTVELWFDPGIRRQTKMNDSDLRALFPNVRVEVMSRRDKADPAVLAAAEFDEHAYVISNDRYADFPDKDPVKNKRIFTHIIHPQSIQIQALDLNIPYQQQQVPL
jgi:hypothetical protein